jgi:hypothetical protein
MITCREATRLMSEGLDRKLPLARRAALRLHLLICLGCAAMAERMAFLRRALRANAGRDGPGDGKGPR